MQHYIVGNYWPTRLDYDLALENFTENMLDPELRASKLEVQQRTGMLIHRGRPDAYTCLYRIGDWMIRCFCHSEMDDSEARTDLIKRYQLLEQFYRKNHTHVSALVPTCYIEQGIRVDFFKRSIPFISPSSAEIYVKTSVVPIIKMPFVKGMSLSDFIQQNHQNAQQMRLLSNAWLKMIQEMEAVHMAHGDLDLTNVRVTTDATGTGIVLKLIDYDNTWLPDFARFYYPLLEHGHEFFQHPYFLEQSQTFDETIDRFAALIIYISLLVLIDYPELYMKWELNDDRLLFHLRDFHAEQQGQAGRISQLQAMHVSGLEPYREELSLCLRMNRMPRSLTAIASDARRSEPTSEQTTASVNSYDIYEVYMTDWSSVEYFPEQAEAARKPVPLDQSQLQPWPLPSQQEPDAQPWKRSAHQKPNPYQAPLDNKQPYEPAAQAPLPFTPPDPRPVYQPEYEHSQQRPPAYSGPPESPLLPRDLNNDLPWKQPVPPRQSAHVEASLPAFSAREAPGQPFPTYRNPESLESMPLPAVPGSHAREQHATFDKATWLGCAIVLFLVIVTIVIIILLISHAHTAQHGPLPQLIYQFVQPGGLHVRD